MPKMDLTTDAKENAIAEVNTTREVVVAEHEEVRSDELKLGQISGEVEERDFNFPKLNLVQSVGPLSGNFDAGTIVYRKEKALLRPVRKDGEETATRTDGHLVVTVLNAKKQYIEVVKFGDPGAIVDTAEEVRALGGTTKWVDNVPPTFTPLGTMLFLFESPEPLQGGYEFNGTHYGLGLFAVKKSQYSAFKTVCTASQFHLSGGLHTGAWNFSAVRERSGKNMVWKPKLEINEEKMQHSPEFIEWVSTLL